MNLPKQPLNIDRERQALAPYNFVELPERVAAVLVGSSLLDKEKFPREHADAVNRALPDQNIFHADQHSGWIDCHLITASPIYVRAPRTREEADKQIESKDLPAFFYEWDKNEPVIPGSSLRGMLRSLVEIASCGKITAVSDSQLIYRAVGDPTNHGASYRKRLLRDENHAPGVRAGYIRREGSDWYIQPAQSRGGLTFAKIYIDNSLFSKLAPVSGCRNAYKIYVDVAPPRMDSAMVVKASAVQAPGLFEATLACSGYMNNKRTEAVVYPPDSKAKKFKLSDDLVKIYLDQITPKQEDLLGKDGVLKDVKYGHPVFYILTRDEKEVVFFGHCRTFRLPYKHNPSDYAPEQLRRKEDIDLAEAIFGFTKDLPAQKHCEKERRYAGRIKVGDARLVSAKEDLWLSTKSPIMTRILGSPKPTTFQHYLVQQKPHKKGLVDYNAGTPTERERGETVIRGNKLYWHKGAVTQADIEFTKSDPREKSKDSVTTRIQPLRAGVRFDFRIQFENLSSAELGALLWALRIGADDRYRLKLGMGKPIGMGAVKVIPTLRLIDRSVRYSNLFDGDGWNIGLKPSEQAERIETEAIEAFERFVIGKVGDSKAQRLADLDRIKQLLVMLQWPGPDRSLTRYLEIQRKEYVNRPVLPHPLSIANLQEPAVKPTPDKPQSTASQSEDVIPEGHKRGFVIQWGLGPKTSSGFIKPADGGEKVFVHLFEVKDRQLLKELDEVAYAIRNTESGPEATDVRLIHRHEGEDS